MSALPDDLAEVRRLVGAIRPMLAGRPPQVQGAALADLLAAWLAGHVKVGDPEETRLLREDMLEAHMTTVRMLVEPNYKLSVEPQLRRKTQ